MKKINHNINAMIVGVIVIIVGSIEYSMQHYTPFIIIIVMGVIGLVVGLIRFLRGRFVN